MSHHYARPLEPIQFTSPCDHCGSYFTQRMLNKPLRYVCTSCDYTRLAILAREKNRRPA